MLDTCTSLAFTFLIPFLVQSYFHYFTLHFGIRSFRNFLNAFHNFGWHCLCDVLKEMPLHQCLHAIVLLLAGFLNILPIPCRFFFIYRAKDTHLLQFILLTVAFFVLFFLLRPNKILSGICYCCRQFRMLLMFGFMLFDCCLRVYIDQVLIHRFAHICSLSEVRGFAIVILVE